jgi:hypothetical protein
LGDGKTFVVRTSFSFYRIGNNEQLITVPEGFDSDGASVPRIFWPILPRWGKYGKAAILHDYMYRIKEYSRKECDDVMLEAMKVLEVPEWEQALIYRSLRSFGWGGWYRLKSQKGWENMYKDKFRQLV